MTAYDFIADYNNEVMIEIKLKLNLYFARSLSKENISNTAS